MKNDMNYQGTGTDWQESIVPLLPQRARRVLEVLPHDFPLTELRLRAGGPLQLVTAQSDRLIYAEGGKPMLYEDECAGLLSALCAHSVYAWEEELRNGFVTLPGGLRVGLAGRAIREEDKTLRFSVVDSFCFRIVRECRGVALPYVRRLFTEQGRLCSSLIVSPPGLGKTTLLRDLVRVLSDGITTAPYRVGVADERFELAGRGAGNGGFDLGTRTDVISGLSKADGLQRLLRSMSPQVLAVDELSSMDDARAALSAQSGGVTLLATAHGANLESLFRREPLRILSENGVFERFILLSGIGLPGCVYDAEGKPCPSMRELAG